MGKAASCRNALSRSIGSEFRIFWSVGSRLMLPALVTVLMLQFVAIWNNFLLPFVMLNNSDLYPLTLACTA
jgi:multiple sugar transport system permease protein